MKTQEDSQVRVVALENLRAICERQSGMAHRFWIDGATKAVVRVTYSNPNEYGNERPMTMILRAFPSAFPGDSDNPRVILTAGRVINDTWDGEGWQAFEPILSCPVLFRHPQTNVWSTREEIEKQRRESKG